MTAFYVEYVGEDIPGIDKCNFVRAPVEAYTHQQAVDKFVEDTGIDPFRIVEVYYANPRMRVEEWNGMD